MYINCSVVRLLWDVNVFVQWGKLSEPLKNYMEEYIKKLVVIFIATNFLLMEGKFHRMGILFCSRDSYPLLSVNYLLYL